MGVSCDLHDIGKEIEEARHWSQAESIARINKMSLASNVNSEIIKYSVFPIDKSMIIHVWIITYMRTAATVIMIKQISSTPFIID